MAFVASGTSGGVWRTHLPAAGGPIGGHKLNSPVGILCSQVVRKLAPQVVLQVGCEKPADPEEVSGRVPGSKIIKITCWSGLLGSPHFYNIHM